MYKLLNQPISESDLVNKQYVDRQISEELTFEYISKFNYINTKLINGFNDIHNSGKIIIENYLYEIGNGITDNKQVVRINLKNGVKESLSQLPYGGTNFTPVYDDDNKIYVIGGYGTPSIVNAIQCYNIKDNTWEVINVSNPLSIRGHAACFYNESIYLFGGIISSSTDYTNIYKYDIKLKNFILLPVKLKHDFISYHGSFTKSKNKIYLGDSFIRNIISKEIEVFDLSNETLSYIANPEPNVVYYTMSYYDNKIWCLFGGVNDSGKWVVKSDSCKYYDIKDKNWYFLNINDNNLPYKEDSTMLSVYSEIYDNKIIASYDVYDSSTKKYISYLAELSINSNKVIAYLKENEKIYADGNLLTDNNEVILPETIYTATKDVKIYALNNINFGWIRRGGAGGPISIGSIIYTVWTDDIYSKNGEIWLKCNGQTISEDKYKVLFGLLQKNSSKNIISIPNIPQNATGQFAYIKAIGDIQDYFVPNVLYVGSILKTVWKDNIFKKDGEVWLKCNGQEFYSTDYPELSEFLKSSNYEYDPVIPTMTSNTTPPPFVLSASSEYRSDYAAYFATFSGNAWISGGDQQNSYDSEGNGNQYVKVDVGESINIKRYCFFPYSMTGTTGIVKEWKLEGSNDELTWNILDFKTKEDWVLGTFKPDYFNIVNENTYRYYKITILKIMIDPSNNPSNKQTGMGGLQLFKVKPPKNKVPLIPEDENGNYSYIKAKSYNLSVPTPIQVGGELYTAWKDNIYNKNNEVWLKCNGQEFNPNDYPELAEILYPDGVSSKETALIPNMTSANAPAPYVVTCSSRYISLYDGWKAFDGNKSSTWFSKYGTYDKNKEGYEWISIDMGKPIGIDEYGFYPYYVPDVYGYVTSWIVGGSNDQNNWDIIDEVENHTFTTGSKEYKVELAQRTQEYRYYIFIVTKLAGSATDQTKFSAAIYEMQLYQLEREKYKIPILPLNNAGQSAYIKAKGFNPFIEGTTIEEKDIYTLMQIGAQLYTVWKDDIFINNQEYWLKCNGQEFSPLEYPKLAEYITEKDGKYYTPNIDVNNLGQYAYIKAKGYNEVLNDPVLSLIQVGTYMETAWTESIYTKHNETWLKCNGQKFSKEDYPLLYDFLNNETIPDIPANENGQNTYIKAKGYNEIIEPEVNITSTIPVGAQLYTSWKTEKFVNDNEIWLECNGKTFDPNEYPELAEIIGKTEKYDKNTIEPLIPIMTSENSPAPFKITQTSSSSGGRLGWNAFSGKDQGWESMTHTFNTDGTVKDEKQYITIDLGKTYDNIVKYTFGNNNTKTTLHYIVLGSIDNNEFFKIDEQTIENLDDYTQLTSYIYVKDYDISLKKEVRYLRVVIDKVIPRYNDYNCWLPVMQFHVSTATKKDYFLPDLPKNMENQSAYIKAKGYNELLNDPILSLIQVGTYMETAWTDDIYTNNTEVWLKCNGQSFSKESYPLLYNFLSSENVPNIPVNENGQNTYIKAEGYNELLENPIISIIQIGTYQETAWTDNIYANNGEVWLKCNGQTFNTEDYPTLSKFLENNTVPNIPTNNFGQNTYIKAKGYNEEKQTEIPIVSTLPIGSQLYTTWEKDTFINNNEVWLKCNGIPFNEEEYKILSEILGKTDKYDSSTVESVLPSLNSNSQEGFYITPSDTYTIFNENTVSWTGANDNFDESGNGNFSIQIKLDKTYVNIVKYSLSIFETDRPYSFKVLGSLDGTNFYELDNEIIENLNDFEKIDNTYYKKYFSLTPSDIQYVRFTFDKITNGHSLTIKNLQLYSSDKKVSGYYLPNLPKNSIGQFAYVKADGYNVIEKPKNDGSLFQIGTIVIAAWEKDVFSNNGETWLKCNNQLFNTSDYPKLAEYIAKKDTGLVEQYRTPNMSTGFSGQYYFIKAKGYNEALIELINTPNQIGSTTKAIWSENIHSFNNEVWLKCNGDVINQSEYPELANFLIETNNINIITEKSIVPLMTSNSEPSSFIVSASSTNNLELNRPYKVFDQNEQTEWQGLQGLWTHKINNDGTKVQNVFSGNDFIQIQLDKTYKLSSYSLSTCDKDSDSGRIYSWKLEGSNDGINWSLINEIKSNSENKNVKINLLDQNIGDFYLYRLVIYECYSTTQTDETKISPSIYNLSLFTKNIDSLRLPDIKLDTDNLYTYIKAKGSPITFPSPVQIGSQMFTVWTEDIHRVNNEVWLKCNGQNFSKIDYPALFNLTGYLRVPNIEKNNIGQYCYIKAAGFTAGSYNIEDGIFDQQVLTWDKATNKWIGRIMTGNISTGNIGEIFFWGSTEAPEDSLLCDGSSISREKYSNLFAVIGTKYGEGDGKTTFNIPSISTQIGGTIACIRFKNVLTSSSLGNFILEAPIDNKEYVRKNGEWKEISNVPDSLQETLDNLLSKIEILEKEINELKNPKVRSITILGLDKIVLTK